MLPLSFSISENWPWVKNKKLFDDFLHTQKVINNLKEKNKTATVYPRSVYKDIPLTFILFTVLSLSVYHYF